MAWLIGFPLVFLANLQRMLPLVGLKMAEVFRAITMPMLAAAGMYVCVSFVRSLLPAGLPPSLVMALLVATGVTAYSSITFAANFNGLREVMDLFRKGSTERPNPRS
jgi:hypothetical protein